MPATSELPAQIHTTELLDRVCEHIGTVILGKKTAIRLSLACILARGHLLIEDLPGMGKTTLAHAIAQTLGLKYQRIQFTSDLLPADILGAAVYERQSASFVFHPGPIFSQVVLADEINRATPKTQSALLESMEERQVTIEGETRALPEPFFVIATQNPLYQVGTFPLPESQLDRFLMCITLGYPDSASERALLAGENRRSILAKLPAILDSEQLHALQNQVSNIHVAPPLLDYLQNILHFSRNSSDLLRGGLSPRAGLAVLQAARAWALLEGRSFVSPDDLQQILPAVVGHRLHGGQEQPGQSRAALVDQLLAAVDLPA